MITPHHMQQALQAAIAGSMYMTSKHEFADPQIICAAGLTNFVNAVLTNDPQATVADVRNALLTYVRSQP